MKRDYWVILPWMASMDDYAKIPDDFTHHHTLQDAEDEMAADSVAARIVRVQIEVMEETTDGTTNR